ncbi:hypothetical protein J6590_079569 [Homalodisca vitripennis]|nr:hypothetical protein J6590_079569 [Homalodisca vitripennis]
MTHRARLGEAEFEADELLQQSHVDSSRTLEIPLQSIFACRSWTLALQTFTSSSTTHTRLCTTVLRCEVRCLTYNTGTLGRGQNTGNDGTEQHVGAVYTYCRVGRGARGRELATLSDGTTWLGSNTVAAQPTRVRPSAAQPTRVRPSAAQPTLVRPSAAQPTLARPSAAQPTLARPSAAQPTHVRPSAAQPTLARPSALSQHLHVRQRHQPPSGSANTSRPSAAQQHCPPTHASVSGSANTCASASANTYVRQRLSQPVVAHQHCTSVSGSANTARPSAQPTHVRRLSQHVRPSAAQPTHVRPSAAQPTHVRPSAAQPTHVRPSAAQPTLARPSAAQPTHVRPLAAQPTHVRPLAAQPTLARSLNMEGPGEVFVKPGHLINFVYPFRDGWSSKSSFTSSFISRNYRSSKVAYNLMNGFQTIFGIFYVVGETLILQKTSVIRNLKGETSSLAGKDLTGSQLTCANIYVCVVLVQILVQSHVQNHRVVLTTNENLISSTATWVVTDGDERETSDEIVDITLQDNILESLNTNA